jgi:hypothetical protein
MGIKFGTKLVLFEVPYDKKGNIKKTLRIPYM